MSHIFLSYARKDSPFTHGLADYLVRAGFDVWIDDHSINFGQDWETAIFQGIQSCAVFVVVMTPASDKSNWVRRECIYADRLGKPTIPLLRGGEPFPRYGDLHYVDVTGRNPLPSSFVKQLAQYAPQKATRGQNLALPLVASNSSQQVSSHPHLMAYNPRLKRVGAASLIAFGILIVAVMLLLALGNMASKTAATQTANELANAPTEAKPAFIVDTPTLTDTLVTENNTLPAVTVTVENASSAVAALQVESTNTEVSSATAAIYLSPTLLLEPLIFTPTQITRLPTQVSNFKPLITSAPLPQSGVSAPVVNQNTSPLPTTIVLPTKSGNNNPNPPTVTKRPPPTIAPTNKPPSTIAPTNKPPSTIAPTLIPTTNPGALQLLGSFVAPGGLPNGIACDGQFLWLSDNSATIFKVDMSGNPLGAYSAPEGTSQGIAWVGDRFYVMTTNRNRVYAFQIQGFDLKTLSWFQGPGQVTGDNDMAWDGTNIWYSLNFNVYKLNADGTVVGGFTSGKVVNGLAWDGTNFWMAVDYSFKILQVNQQGQVLATFEVPVAMINGLDWCDNTLWVVGQDQIMEPMKVYRFKR